VGKLIEVQGNIIVRFWRREWRRALKVWRWLRISGTSNRTMTQNTLQKRQTSGFLTTTSFP